jgi:hypothetical protein
MNAALSERDKDTDKQERMERIKESRYNREYETCMTEEIAEYLLPGERECKREKNEGEIPMWKRGERGIGRKKRKEGAGCATRRERRLSTYGEMRETAGERVKILNEDGRELGWMKELWKRRERTEKKRGIRIKKVILFGNFLNWQIKNFVVLN